MSSHNAFLFELYHCIFRNTMSSQFFVSARRDLLIVTNHTLKALYGAFGQTTLHVGK